MSSTSRHATEDSRDRRRGVDRPSAQRSHEAPGLTPARRARRQPGSSFPHRADQTAGYQSGDIRKDARDREPARRREIPRLPLRIELLLVLPQAAEVIEVLAVPIDDAAKTGPRGRE